MPIEDGRACVITRKSGPGVCNVKGLSPKDATTFGVQPPMKSVILLALRSPPRPPTKAPDWSKTVTEVDVGIRLSGVADAARPCLRSSSSSPFGLTSSSLTIPA